MTNLHTHTHTTTTCNHDTQRLDPIFEEVMEFVAKRYNAYLTERVRFNIQIEATHDTLHTVSGLALWREWLAAIPEADRQYFTCGTCRTWFIRYAGLVDIDENGDLSSPIFAEENFPEYFTASAKAVRERINQLPIIGSIMPSSTLSGEMGTPPDPSKEHGYHFYTWAPVAQNVWLESHYPLTQVRNSVPLFRLPKADFDAVFTYLNYSKKFGAEYKHTKTAKHFMDMRARKDELTSRQFKHLVMRVSQHQNHFSTYTSLVRDFIQGVGKKGLNSAATSFEVRVHDSNYKATSAPISANALEKARVLFVEMGYDAKSIPTTLLGLKDNIAYGMNMVQKVEVPEQEAQVDDPFKNAAKQIEVEQKHADVVKVTMESRDFIAELSKFEPGTTYRVRFSHRVRSQLGHATYGGLPVSFMYGYEFEGHEQIKSIYKGYSIYPHSDKRVLLRPVTLHQFDHFEGNVTPDTWFNVVAFLDTESGDKVAVLEGLELRPNVFTKTPYVPGIFKDELHDCRRVIQMEMDNTILEIQPDCVGFADMNGITVEVSQPGRPVMEVGLGV